MDANHWFHWRLITTIIRQRKKDIGEVEKIEK